MSVLIPVPGKWFYFLCSLPMWKAILFVVPTVLTFIQARISGQDTPSATVYFENKWLEFDR